MRRGSLGWLALGAVALLLSACGSVPLGPQAGGEKVARNAGLPPAGSGRGGYYMDDGPGDNPPPGLENTPDAEPKLEPYSATGNKPYVVFGKTYVPVLDERPMKQRGRGSWYGRKFHGQRTSSGEPYDMYKMTAAHATLPIPSYVRVTNLSNGRQVIVRVNDRGPFHSERIIDLSYTAALKLGYLGSGSAELEVERILPAEIERLAAAGAAQGGQGGQGALPVAVPLAEAIQVSVLPAEPAPPAAVPPVNTAPAVPATASAAAGAGLYLQLGAYSKAANAESARRKLAQNWVAGLPPLQVVQSEALFRLYSGPFGSRYEANSAAQQLQGNGISGVIVVQR